MTGSGHTIAEMMAKLKDLGISTYIIPRGRTCLVQPVDVDINRPFKHKMEDL